jgi:hypothetical protein
MEGYRWIVVLLTSGLAACVGNTAAGEEHTHCRAGCPLRVACYAVPSDTGRYVGYYVGGGAAIGGTHRYCEEGTWGWDYQGHFLPHRVILYWSHWRCQGGPGAYRTEGPRVPDLPACAAAAVNKTFHKCRDAAGE